MTLRKTCSAFAFIILLAASGIADSRAPLADGELIPCMGVRKLLFGGEQIWFGYCDRSYRMVIPPEYTRTYPFLGDFAVAEKNGRFGVIDRNGKKRIPFAYDAIGLCASDSRKTVLAVTNRHTSVSLKFQVIGGGIFGPSGFVLSEIGDVRTLVNLTTGSVIDAHFSPDTSLYPFGDRLIIDDDVYSFEADGSIKLIEKDVDCRDYIEKYAVSVMHVKDPRVYVYGYYDKDHLITPKAIGKDIPRGFTVGEIYPYVIDSVILPSTIQEDWLNYVYLTKENASSPVGANGIYNQTKKRWEVAPFFIKRSELDPPFDEPVGSAIYLLGLHPTNDPDIWECSLEKDDLGTRVFFDNKAKKLLPEKKIRADIPVVKSRRYLPSGSCDVPYPGMFQGYTGFVE